MLSAVHAIGDERKNAEKNKDPRDEQRNLPIVEDGFHELVASPSPAGCHGSKPRDGAIAPRRIVYVSSPRLITGRMGESAGG